MDYTFHQLKVFLKVVEKGSITKASEELHLTQPAVSIQLKKLQDQFELPLTEVVGRQLYITDFGLQIAKRSQNIMDEAEEIRFTVDQYKGLVTGSIRISVVSTGKYVMPYFLKPFMDLYPQIEISLDVSNKNKVIQTLVNNESDFSLVSVLPQGIAVNKIELVKNQLFLVGGKQHSNLVKKPSDLSDQTLLFREEGSATRKAMEQYLDQHNVVVGKSMELVSNEAVKQAINAGIGFSIVPLIGLRSYLTNESIELVPLKGLPIITNWNLIYGTSKKLTPAMSALVTFIQNHKNQVIKDHFNWTISETKV